MSAVKKSKKQENFNDILKEIAKLDAKKSKEQQGSNSSSASSSNTSAQVLVQQQSTPPAKKKKTWPKTQTSPEPTVPIQYLFAPLSVNKTTKVATGGFPVGELMPYTRGTKAVVVAAAAADSQQQLQQKLVNVPENDAFFEQELQKARKAAEIHRTVRKWVQSWLKPGLKLVDICERTENKIRELIENDSLQGGIAFPIGCSVNHCAAHYNPNPGDQTVLQNDDVLKIDIGIHEQGRIIDSAFTMCWNPKFQPLLNAVREATNAGIKAAGVDVLLGDVGAAIQEVMESHEVELNGKVHRVKTIRNLCGHSIDRYHIHAGKTVPCVAEKKSKKANARMDENEFFAIETFGSINGEGYVEEVGENSHFMKDFDAPPASVLQHQLKSKAAKELLQTIETKFGTLAWCPRYLERFTGQWNKMALSSLVRANIVHEYPPLCDVPGSYVAQFEHTIVLRGGFKEVLSRGDDY